MNKVVDPPDRIIGVGTFVPPEGMTPEQAERLAREADETRKPKD